MFSMMASGLAARTPRRAALLLLVAASFTMLAGAGCGKDEPLPPETPALGERVSFPRRPLTEVLQAVPSNVTVRGVEIEEEPGRVLSLRLAPPTTAPDEIVAQYNVAYERNYLLLVQLLSNESADSPAGHGEAVQAELAHLEALREQARTKENIALVGLTVDGTPAQIDELRHMLLQDGGL